MKTKQKPTQRPRLFVMNDPYPLRISAQLALEIGFNESVVLLQIEYLISISNTEPRDGLLWTYQSLDDLNSYFPWWGRETINRAVHSLQQQGLIRIDNFNQRKSDHTRWFALDPEGVARLNSVRLDTGVVMTENARRAPKKPTEPRIPESHFETGQPNSESQNETPESHFETGESQNETTLPETPTVNPNIDSTAAAEVNLTSGAQNFSAAAGLDFSAQTPEKRQKPDPDPNHWTLRELVRANTINRKKLDELERAGTDPRALAQWLVEAHRKTGLTNPIGYAVQNAIAYPEGKNLRDSVFAHRPKADLLDWLAKAIARYPLSQGAPDIAAMLRGISQPNLRSLYFALGGDEDDIPAAYVPPAPKPRPAAPVADEPVEVPAAVLARAESFRARRQK